MAEINWQQKNNWIHFIGVGGVITGQLAAACARAGNYVTGSTGSEFYEPIKSYLLGLEKEGKLKLASDWDYRNLTLAKYTGLPEDEHTLPGLVIAQGGLSLKNKEVLFAQKRGIEVKHFAKYLAEELVVTGGSIVVAGSFGKTTVTGLIAKIIQESGLATSYAIGGLVADFEHGIELDNSGAKYSVVEGDEYISARWDMQSKFFYYRPNYLVLTGYAYDHTDIFKTEEDYYNNFAKLVAGLDEKAVLIYNEKYSELAKLAEIANCKAVPYRYDPDNFDYETSLIGDYNRENILAAATLANELGLSTDIIRSSVAGYRGAKRRLELISQTSDWSSSGDSPGQNSDLSAKVRVIDDFGATPKKAEASINAVKKEFPDAKLIALFEPNFGSRTKQALPGYSSTFASADFVGLLPFTEINQEGIISQNELASKLHEFGYKPVMLTETIFQQVISAEIEQNRENIILFLSSHSIDRYLGMLS